MMIEKRTWLQSPLSRWNLENSLKKIQEEEFQPLNAAHGRERLRALAHDAQHAELEREAPQRPRVAEMCQCVTGGLLRARNGRGREEWRRPVRGRIGGNNAND